VSIQVVTSAGMPVPGVSVALNGNFDGRLASTDVSGRVAFDDIAAGDAHAHTWVTGFHSADVRFVVSPGPGNDITLVVEEVTEAVPVILGTRATPASDGLTLAVDVDVAVLGEDGRSRETLTAADFGVADSDCGFMWCVIGGDGAPLDFGGYVGSVEPEPFAWHASTGEALPLATALLIEQSSAAADIDPHGVRLDAVNTFLDGVIAPESVALASYRGMPPAGVLTTYGDFTSDGGQLRAAVSALGGQEAGTNPLYDAVSEMLSFTTAHAPGGPDDPPRTLVLVSSNHSWPDDSCGSSWTCRHQQRLSVAAASQSPGIPVVTIGGSEPAADLAARSGGAFVSVDDPAQYPLVLASLRSIATGRLAHNRVRLVLDAAARYGAQAEPVFRQGNTVWTHLYVRIGPNTQVLVPLAIAI
jgi:hypothetical protein